METEQSKYEKQKGLVARAILREQVLGLIDSLGETDFHRIYDLIWSISANDLLKKCYFDDRARLERDNKELQAKLDALNKGGF